MFIQEMEKNNNSTHVNSISSTYISSTNTNIIDKQAHTHTKILSPHPRKKTTISSPTYTTH